MKVGRGAKTTLGIYKAQKKGIKEDTVNHNRTPSVTYIV